MTVASGIFVSTARATGIRTGRAPTGEKPKYTQAIPPFLQSPPSVRRIWRQHGISVPEFSARLAQIDDDLTFPPPIQPPPCLYRKHRKQPMLGPFPANPASGWEPLRRSSGRQPLWLADAIAKGKMTVMPSVDRQRGSLFGLAIGDALGAAVEFEPPGTFPEVTGYRGGGPHGLAPGEFTDDTSMALALANSIASVGWDLDDQARRYVAWYEKGWYSVNGRCVDIGMTCRSALNRFSRTGDAKTSGDSSEHASGNGSIMRLAPVPIKE